MSTYTTQLRFVCENAIGLQESVSYNQINAVVEQARTQLFQNYPIFDEAYRGVLETKILKHFYMREICSDPVAMWKLWLNNKMNEIMPFYNQLYKSELLVFNPLFDVDLTTDSKRNESGATSNTMDNTANSEAIGKVTKTETNDSESSSNTINHSASAGSNTNMKANSDTPQGVLDNVENLKYLSSATSDNGSNSITADDNSDSNTENHITSDQVNDSTNTATSTANTSANSDFTNLNDYLEHVKGKRGGNSYSKMLLEFRETFLNIDMMIINDLNELFFSIY